MHGLRHYRFLIVVLALLGADAFASVPALRSVQTGQSITLSTARLQWTVPTVRQRGKNASRPSLPYLTGTTRPMRIGAPDLPMLTALVALPNGERPTFEIIDQQSTMRTVEDIARIDTGTTRNVILPEVAAPGMFWPPTIVEIGAPAVMRGMHVVRVRIAPAQYNPTTRQLKLYSSIRVVIHPRGAAPATQAAQRDSRAWDAFAASLILNYRDAQQWRAAPVAQRTAARPLAGASERVKIFVNANGIYRITGRDLDSVLGPLRATIDPRTVHLYYFHPDTTELPIRLTGAADGRFDDADTLEFAATMHYGEEGDYFDDYTDTNVYWLLWGDPAPQHLYRMAGTGAPAQPLIAFTLPEHYEKDIEYYQGDHVGGDYGTIYITEKVSGERFYWEYLDPVSKPALTFDAMIGGIPDDGSTATIRVHMRGVSSVDVIPDHEMSIELNGEQLADVPMVGWQDTLVQIVMPCKHLYNGLNQITIRALTTQGFVNQVAVDYVEIVTPRQTVFTGDSTYLTIPPGAHTFTLHHAPSPQLTILDPTSGTMPAQTSVAGGTFVRMESRGSNDRRIVRVELNDSTVFASPYARGINVVVIDPATGATRDIQHFDTYASATASAQLIAYLAAIPRGVFVAMAVCDEAATLLSDSARAVIRGFGSAHITALAAGDGWAFVFRAGDASFTPLEDHTRSGAGGAHLTGTIPTTAIRSWAVTCRDSVTASSSVVAQASASIRTPRMALRRTTDLHNASHRADYIVIAHRSLIEQARRLAAFRAQHDHLDTAVVDVEDIYDEYNGGIERELPIREFLRTAYTSWSRPAPAMAVLFGDATWDPKFNTVNAWRKNLVPTHGKPVSDYWYTLLEGDDVLPEMLVGRIPSPTVDTARAVVDKIIAYAGLGPQRWNKDFLFVSGGSDMLEATFLQNYLNNERQFIQPPPVCGRFTMISRDNWDDPLQTNKSREITQRVNEGAVWFTYFGHAAPNIFEIVFDSASVFRNSGRWPFFSAFSCQTGAFAEPRIISANEQYMIEPEQGFVASWGITGFGSSHVDAVLIDQAYQLMGDSSVRQLGALTTRAKVALWTGLDSLVGGDTINVKNTIMQYSLLGDPATILALRAHPDVEILDSDIVVLPAGGAGSVVTDQDTAYVLQLAVHNNGTTSGDTVQVRVHVEYAGGALDTSMTIAVPCRVDTIRLSIPVRQASGQHTITVTLDPALLLPQEEDRANNIAHASVQVLSSVLTVLRPSNYGSQAGSCRPNTIAVLVPQVGASALQYVVELDSSASFTQPLARSGNLAPPAGPVLEWTIPIAMDAGRTYYWRARTINTSSGALSEWVQASFSTDGPAWEQRSAAQFGHDATVGAVVQADGVHLGVDRQLVRVESRGFSVPSGRGVRVQLADQLPYNDPVHRGMFVYVLSDSALAIDRSQVFDTFMPDNDSLQATLFAQYIDSIPSGRVVIVAASDEPSGGLSTVARAALRTLGAALADSIGFRASYALIGRKGAAPGTVPEQWRPDNAGAAVLADTIAFQFLRGLVTSPRIGPAAAWGMSSATFRLPAGTGARMTILGERHATGVWDSLGVVTGASGSIDLSAVDARVYRFVQLRAQLTRSDVNAEPVLTRWNVAHAEVPELLIYAPTYSLVPDTVLEGETPQLDADVYNTGCVVARRVPLRVQLHAPGLTKLAASATFDSIAARGIRHLRTTLATEGTRGPQSVLVTVDPADTIPEIVETNNTLVGALTVRTDTTRPSVVVTVDGRQVLNGDVVSPTPEVIVKMYDNSPLPIVDPQSVIIRVDTIDYSMVRTPDRMALDTGVSGVKLRAVLHPWALGSGYHEVRVFATDATRNTDSTYDRLVRVELANSLTRVMNAPNPFARETYFTFILTGQQQATGGQIKIFSVAGRILRTIDVPASSLRIGFNAILWDGTDEDGDRLANGAYLYKMIVHLPDGDLMQTERMAVLR